MPYIQFNGMLIEYSPQRTEGELCTLEDAKYLNHLLAKQVQEQINLWLSYQDPVPDREQIGAKVKELCVSATLPDIPDDPVQSAALDIAKEKIIARLAAEGLPPPAGLDTHAAELVRLYPSLLKLAEVRVQARLTVARGTNS
jgi:hypothetical protein